MKPARYKNNFIFTGFLIITGFVFTAFAADPDPEIVSGVSTEDIDEIFEMYDKDNTPGCAVAVYRDGQTIFSRGYGIANLDYGIPISETGAFYMASISKQFTAAAAALLAVRGRLNIEAGVGEYIEEWPEWASEVKVHHLFNHSSGVPDIYGLMGVAGISTSNVMELEDYLAVINMGESLMFEPGSEYSYTNSGYTALAIIVEEISEKKFSEFVNDEFLEPFGMNSSHFHDNRYHVIPNRVISYAPSDGEYRRSYLGNFQGVGGGGLYSTVEDFSKWDAFWNDVLEWEGGITQEEAEELKQMMTTPGIIGGEEHTYSMGLHTETEKGAQVIGHGGSFMGFKNDYRRYPESATSFLTLCNRGDAVPRNLNREVADLFLKNQFEAYLAPYEGVYRNEELPVEYSLTIEDGNLKLNRRLSPNGFMTQDDEDIWSAGSWEFVFTRNGSGDVNGFVVSTGRAREVEFSKVGNTQ